MKIIIEIGDEVSAAAEARIRTAVAASGRHECDFQGVSLVVRRGDYTCIAEGGGHSDAARLFALVQRLSRDDKAFAVDADGFTLIPISCGGFEKVVVSAKNAAQRQADLKSRRLRDGLMQWKRWVHPDDVPALTEYAAKLARKRARSERAG